MKNYPLTVTATEQTQQFTPSCKYLKITVGSTAVLVNIRMTVKPRSQADEEDFVTLTANKTYYVRARANKPCYAIRYKTSSGSSTLAIVAGNEEFFLDYAEADVSNLETILNGFGAYIYNGTGSPMAANTSVKDMLDDLKVALTFQHKAPFSVNSAPVQNEWIVDVDAQNVRLFTYSIRNADNTEDLEIRFTMDGVVNTRTQAAGAVNTRYYATCNADNTVTLGTTKSLVGAGLTSKEFRELKIEHRKTSAISAGSRLISEGLWEQR
ncbi:MAG: hypothetical protein ACQCN3_02610 [Candidatus Bathyarchaeia archaeon]|jgi:hypothetical protein